MKPTRISLVLGLALLAACSTEMPGSSPGTTASPTPSVSLARQVAYVTTDVDGAPGSTQSDVWLYDVVTDAVTRLTSDGKTHQERLPRFHGTKVSYVVDGRMLVEVDPATRKKTTILTVAGGILGYDWHEDEVAYLENDARGTHRLRVRDVVSGTTTTLKALGTPPGRGTGLDDAVSIAWSRDGKGLLVTDTHVDTEATVRLLRRDGSDVIDPIRQATNALWSSDERSIYLRDLSLTKPRWERYEIASRESEVLSLDGTAHHATLSPDGRTLAAVRFDGPEGPHTITLLDLTTMTSRNGPTGARDPVWISANSFAATRVTGCAGPDDDACLYFGFRGSGTRLYLANGSSKALMMATTLWDGLGGANVDVLEA